MRTVEDSAQAVMPNSDTFEIDFADLKTKAGDMIDQLAADKEAAAVPPTPPAEPTVAKVESVDATPVVAKDEGTASKVEPPAEPSVSVAEAKELDPEKDGDTLVRVKVDGQWETKPLKEVAASFSRTSHFTRQMQGLAQQRQEFEQSQQAFKTREAEFESLKTDNTNIRNFLNNPTLVLQYLRQGNPELFAAAEATTHGANPDEIATVQQARDIVKQQFDQMTKQLQEVQQKSDERVLAVKQEIAHEQERSAHVNAITTTIKDIYEKNPILNKVRMSEDVMRYEVAKLNPKSIDEALEAFRTVAQGMVEDLQEGLKVETTKTKVAETKQKLTRSSIEPPGGAGPQIQPNPNAFKKTDGSIDWKSISKAAEQML